jgi:hypothetical protein
MGAASQRAVRRAAMAAAGIVAGASRRRSGPAPVVLLRLISRDSGKEYEIRQGKDGVVYCSCPRWGFKRTCKHLDDYRAGVYDVSRTGVYNGAHTTPVSEAARVILAAVLRAGGVFATDTQTARMAAALDKELAAFRPAADVVPAVQVRLGAVRAIYIE